MFRRYWRAPPRILGQISDFVELHDEATTVSVGGVWIRTVRDEGAKETDVPGFGEKFDFPFQVFGFELTYPVAFSRDRVELFCMFSESILL